MGMRKKQEFGGFAGKTRLRTTTILAAALLAGPAAAQTAGPKAPFTAILDGNVQSYFGVQSSSTNNGTSNVVTAPVANSHGRAFGMHQDAEGRFTFQATADNGMTYGYFARFPLTSSAISVDGFSIDREDIFFRHPAYGLVEIGNNRGTSKTGFPYTACAWGPQSSVNQTCADGQSEKGLISDPNMLQIDGNVTRYGADNPIGAGRSLHLWYLSPEILRGWTVAFEYGPDGTGRNEEQFVTSTNATTVTISSSSVSKMMNIAGTATHYIFGTGEWGGKVGAGVGYAEGKYIYTPTGKSKAITDALTTTENFSLQWRDIRFAIGHSWKGKSQSAPIAVNRITAWGYSVVLERVSYKVYGLDSRGPQAGDWAYSVWYQYARDKGLYSSTGLWEANYFGGGGGYWVATGLQMFAGVFVYSDYNTHPDNAMGTPAGTSGTLANQHHPKGQVYFAGTTFEF
jgi:hypothetical protein